MRGSNGKRGPLSLAVFVVVIGVDLGSEGDTAASEDSMKLIVTKGLIDHKAVTKVNPSLGTLYQEYQAWRSSVAPDSRTVLRSKNPLIRLSDGYVVIDAVASGDAEQLRTDLEGIGMKNAAVYGRMVSGRLPITAIKALESLESLKSIRPATARTNTGAVNSQGDAALRSDEARITLGVDGTGIRVGALSDSFNCLGGAAAGVLSGDLPAGINVVQEISDCDGDPVDPVDPVDDAADEGRAMMELIHDVAPAATQAFHTAFDGQADFAQGILDLRKAGAKVIVDDVIYFAEPMFQDGIIAQAVDSVVARGVAYFSAAGNDARQSYQSRFRPSGKFVQEGLSCEAHDFDPGSKVDIRQRIRLPAGGVFMPSLQWDQPFFSVSGAPGAQSDLDILLFNTAGNIVAAGVENNVGNDPVETNFFFENRTGATASFHIVITNCAGPNPRRIKYVDFGGDATSIEFDTRSGTVFGHANARGAEAVGAADFQNTSLIEPFSSVGRVPIRLNTDGSPKRKQVLRKKPGIVAPDGTNTTFFVSDRLDDADAFPNFFGTSAAAAHAAAVAALILQNNPTFVPNLVYRRLRTSAIDMGAPGFDFNTGSGFIDALAAAPPGSPGACQGVTATITGSSASDVIIGTPKRDVIVGGRGNDEINGGGGGDLICGNRGNDTLKGGRGRDRLNGGSNGDVCDGGPGRDSTSACERRIAIP